MHTRSHPFPRLREAVLRGWRQPSSGLLVTVASLCDWSAARWPPGTRVVVKMRWLLRDWVTTCDARPLTTSPMHTSDSYIKTGWQSQDKCFAIVSEAGFFCFLASLRTCFRKMCLTCVSTHIFFYLIMKKTLHLRRFSGHPTRVLETGLSSDWSSRFNLCDH